MRNIITNEKYKFLERLSTDENGAYSSRNWKYVPYDLYHKIKSKSLSKNIISDKIIKGSLSKENPSFTVGNYNGGVAILRYSEKCDTLNIPETLDSKKVTAILISSQKEDVQDSYDKDYISPFKDTGVKKIVIPKSIETINEAVFEGLTTLANISVEKNNKVFSDINGVLFNKNKDTLIYFPSGNCKNYSIPSGTKSVLLTAFYDSHLKEIYLPSSLTNFSMDKFLCDIKISKNHPFLSSVNGSVYSKDKRILYLMSYKADSYNMPDEVEIALKGSIFLSNISKISINKALNKIDKFELCQCQNLKYITVNSENKLFKAIDGVLFDKNAR